MVRGLGLRLELELGLGLGLGLGVFFIEVFAALGSNAWQQVIDSNARQQVIDGLEVLLAGKLTSGFVTTYERIFCSNSLGPR